LFRSSLVFSYRPGSLVVSYLTKICNVPFCAAAKYEICGQRAISEVSANDPILFSSFFKFIEVFELLFK
jgi:hypothetical protein